LGNGEQRGLRTESSECFIFAIHCVHLAQMNIAMSGPGTFSLCYLVANVCIVFHTNAGIIDYDYDDYYYYLLSVSP